MLTATPDGVEDVAPDVVDPVVDGELPESVGESLVALGDDALGDEEPADELVDDGLDPESEDVSADATPHP